VAERDAGPDRQRREATANALRYAELASYAAVAIALAVAGLVLFVNVVYSFYTGVRAGNVATSVLSFLDGLLLVFIISEIIHTIRAVIDENVLSTEPFLIVGIVAAIRRLIVATAEAKEHLGQPAFLQVMLEIGVLAASVVALGLTIYLLRHTTRPEPKPRHERAEKPR
jgi:uncharacterized membrane protein (DUF373 family)